MRRLAVAVVLAGAALPASAVGAFSGQNGTIAFSAYMHQELDPQIDTMEPDGSGRQLLIDPDEPVSPTWSPDGTKIAYIDNGDVDQFGHQGQEIYLVNADGTAKTRLTFSHFYKQEPAWSPDGQKLAYGGGGQIRVINADGSGDTALWTAPPNEFADDPAWSPDGSKVAFDYRKSQVGCDDEGGSCLYFPLPGEIMTVNTDGTGLTNLTNSPDDDRSPAWSPDGSKIVFSTGVIEVMNADGSGRHAVAPPGTEFGISQPTWSPDGTKIAYTKYIEWSFTEPGTYDLFVIDEDGTGVVRLTDTRQISEAGADWQALPVPYPRPKGATPVRVSLVPAYRQCTSPDRMHGPPLAFGSCSAPTLQSGELTVGDAPANMSGFVRYETMLGNPATPADEADIGLRVQISDVREQGTLADYAGEVEARANARLTDRNASSGIATSINAIFPLTTQCTPTADTATGSTCSLTTTLDTLIPGAIAEGRRTVMQLSQVQVTDGGPDGDTATEPNTTFLRQGVFVP